VVFDLDDTLLDHGALSEAAYGALFRLREAGLRLFACTGRPAGWGEVIQRQWPVDATVVENGAVALVGEGRALDGAARTARAARGRRAELLELAEELTRRFPATALADDNDARWTDVTLDIGEHRSVPAEQVQEMRALAHARGVRTLQSSVHLHLTREVDDKATGAVRLLVERFGEDPTRALARHAFVGDSANDGAAFAAFTLTFGVANVRGHLGRLSVPPRFVSPSPMGRGFAEIAARLVALRTDRGSAAEGPGVGRGVGA
jgi:hypothetical protein